VAMALASQLKVDEAQPLARQAADQHERLFGRKNPDTMYAKNTYAWTLLAGRRLAEAEPIWREVVADATEVMGVDHPYRLYWLNSLAWCVLQQGNPSEAEPLFAEVSTRREAVLAEGHPDTFSSYLGYVQTLVELNKLDEALPIALRWREAAVARFGPDARPVHEFSAALVRLHDAKGEPSVADRYRAATAPADKNGHEP
jgi:hypothetical protein